MKDLSMDERRSILLDYQTMKPKEIREKWRISQNTLSHIRFFHGDSNAKVHGHYHKPLITNELSPTAERIKSVKDAGGNSEDAARETGVDLEKVNKLWASLQGYPRNLVDEMFT